MIRYVQRAVRTDDELNKFLGNVIIASGGVSTETMPYPTSNPKPGKKSSKKTTKTPNDSDEYDEFVDEEMSGDEVATQPATPQQNEDQAY